MIAMAEVARWFERPQQIVELFLNFDMDCRFVSHWNVFAHVTRAVFLAAEKAVVSLDQFFSEVTVNRAIIIAQKSKIHELGCNALITFATILRLLMEASAHAHFMEQDPAFRARARTLSGGIRFPMARYHKV